MTALYIAGAMTCFAIALVFELGRRAERDIPRLRGMVGHWRSSVRASQREGFEPELRISSENYKQACVDLARARFWARTTRNTKDG
jgi:hypothetical protein